MNAIETFALSKKYLPPRGLMALLAKSPVKKVVTAVDEVNLKVKRGELFGLIGPNGAGKTTFIKLLSTLLWPTSGRALVNGYDLTREEDKVKSSIGFVSGEERSFYWRLTGRENLQFFSALHNLSPGIAQKRINESLDHLELTEAADNMFYSYSSGMKQKLSLARGLLTDPTILFLDEPTKSIDIITAQNLKRFIKETLVKEQERTVIFTSHRLEEVEKLCDRIGIMKKGKIIFCGTTEELMKTLKTPERYRIQVGDLSRDRLTKLGSEHKLVDFSIKGEKDSLLTLEFSFQNGNNPLQGVLNDIFAAGGNLVSCNKKRLSLEKMFTQILLRS